MDTAEKADWIALDWGTSRVRAYAMQGATMLAQAQSDKGMSALEPKHFEPTLVDLIAGWNLPRAVPILACGMIGAKQGLAEAPYRPVPCRPIDGTLTTVTTQTGGLSIHIVPGLSQSTPADVMRGEETQLAGFLALNPGWDGVVCLPGTHTKWAHLSAGEVVSFQTFMTGELFGVLGQISVLLHSIAQDGWDDAAFEAALSEAISRPERLAARLFRLRAEDLLNGQEGSRARAVLSGTLIGIELAATKPYWLGQSLAIVGTGQQARAYQTALEQQGCAPLLVDATRVTLAGLTAARRTLKEAAA